MPGTAPGPTLPQQMDVMKDILDNLNDSIVIIDGYGQIVLFNTEALRIHKLISEKPIQIGAYLTDMVRGSRRKDIAEMLKTLKRQKKPLKNFTEVVTADGMTLFFEVSFVPVLGPKKELRYINVVAVDITSRKMAERSMRKAAADLSTLIENAHAVIFAVDSQGYVVEWNNHCARLTGFSKEEIFSRKFADVLIREGEGSRFGDLMSAVLQNKPVGNYEMALRARSGDEITIMLSATPRTNANGQVIGATIVGQDITELTAYRRSLEKLVQHKTAALEQVLKEEKEAIELKSRFVSLASHEFRSPLSSIDFAASFIKQNAGTIGKKKLNEKVEVIERHVHHMSHLLEDVINFSGKENGRIRVVPSAISLDDFISRTVEEVTCNARHSHHICVSTNRLGSLVTDEKLLRNIVVNLLTNAVKYSPGREEICLNVLDHCDMVTIEVRDEGIGIPKKEIEMIFEPFVRGKGVGAIPGTGLGLSIVKKAVELLNGTILVESTIGKGSVFKVTIPRGRHLN